jgi:aminoglycoside 2''-phosphotransferase
MSVIRGGPFRSGVRTQYLPAARVLKDGARRALGGHPLGSFRIDNAGWTNLMAEVNGQWMFRFPRWPGSARAMGFEVRLLEYLGRHLSIAVPLPVLVGSLDKPRGWPFMAYRKLSGAPVEDLSALNRADRTGLAAFLERLFSELAQLPRGQLRQLGVAPGDKRAWRSKFEALYLRYERTGERRLPLRIQREITRQFEAFYRALNQSSFQPVLLHNDLWPSHILWDSVAHRPVGVIDWEDSRFGDPAFDLAALSGIGEKLMEEMVAARCEPRDDSFEERLLFYRRILPLQGLLFGIETGRSNLARDHLRRLQGSLAIHA